MQDLAGKVAVVTGGASGIGRGIATGLVREGMTVAIADLNVEAAEKAASELRALGGSVIALQVDVTSVASLEAAAKQVAADAGGVNLLLANAGVLGRIASLDDHTIEDWEYTLSVNVLGVVKTVNAFLRLLRRSAPDAHIVNTASLGGLISTPGFPIGAYIASKYACVGYSEMLRTELEPEGIGVSVLCPGVVASDLFATSMRNRPEGFGEQAAPAVQFSPGDEGQPAIVAMPAEEVGPIVLDAVRANRLHVLTHPDSRAAVEARFRGLLDDYAFASKRRA